METSLQHIGVSVFASSDLLNWIFPPSLSTFSLILFPEASLVNDSSSGSQSDVIGENNIPKPIDKKPAFETPTHPDCVFFLKKPRTLPSLVEFDEEVCHEWNSFGCSATDYGGLTRNYYGNGNLWIAQTGPRHWFLLFALFFVLVALPPRDYHHFLKIITKIINLVIGFWSGLMLTKMKAGLSVCLGSLGSQKSDENSLRCKLKSEVRIGIL